MPDLDVLTPTRKATMKKRSLSLRRETLTELTAADLTGVVGAAGGASGPSCPLRNCVELVSDALSCNSCGHSGCCPSIDAC